MPDAGLADGSVLTSANYDTYLREQVVTTCLSGGRPTGKEGRIITETDTDRIVCYDGSSWVRIGGYSSTGRTGCTLARIASQTINTGTWTAVSFDTETSDTDGFIAVTSDTITVPTGLGGIYIMTGSVGWSGTPGTNSAIEFYINGGTSWRFPIGAGSQNTLTACTLTLALSAADTVQFRVYQDGAATRTITSNLSLYRIAA